MKFFKKSHRPKTYRPRRTAKQKAEELIAKSWLKYLKDHPQFAQEVAREKYGLLPSELIGDIDRSDDSGLEIYRKWRKMVREEAEEERPSGGTLQALANSEAGVALVKMLGGILQQMPQQQIAQPEQSQITRREPEQIAAPEPEPEPKSQQDTMRTFANRFLELEPEAAAAELYEYKDKTGDVRQVLWSYLSENGVDEVIEMIPEVITIPDYAFLASFAEKLSTNKGRRWLSLVIDAVNKLKDVESTGET